MENISKLANSVFASKPELELTRIWGELICRNSIPVNQETSEQIQTLVVDAYNGIKTKLGRVNIDSELISGVIEEVEGMVSFFGDGKINDFQKELEKAFENGEIDPNNINLPLGAVFNNPTDLLEAIKANQAPDSKTKVVSMPNTKPTTKNKAK